VAAHVRRRDGNIYFDEETTGEACFLLALLFQGDGDDVLTKLQRSRYAELSLAEGE